MSHHSPIPPNQIKMLDIYVQIWRLGWGGAYIFSDGKVVGNAFRLNIPSDPRMVDIHLFVCITLAIKHNSAKIIALSLPHVTPAHTHIFPNLSYTVYLSNIFV